MTFFAFIFFFEQQNFIKKNTSKKLARNYILEEANFGLRSQSVQCNFTLLHLLEIQKKDFSTTSSKRTDFFGITVPKIEVLRKFHKHQNEVIITASKIFLCPLRRLTFSDQLINECTERWTGIDTPHQIATLTHMLIKSGQVVNVTPRS